MGVQLSSTPPFIKRSIMNIYIIDRPIRWLKYRTIDRYHVFKSKSLGIGYHDLDIRMLHFMFDMLVDFVEIELAWMNVVFTDKKPKLLKKWFFRSKKDGLDYLEWEIKETSGDQQKRAKIVKLLYTWWTKYRPQRHDPWDDIHFNGNWNADWYRVGNNKELKKQMDEAYKIEGIYYDEDTEMLQTLIEIREDLWT